MCVGDETEEEISGVNKIPRLSWAHKKELGGLLQQEPDDYYPLGWYDGTF